MHRSLIAVLGIALCTELGATAAFAYTSALGKLPSAKQTIIRRRQRPAGDDNCDAGQTADINDARVAYPFCVVKYQSIAAHMNRSMSPMCKSCRSIPTYNRFGFKTLVSMEVRSRWRPSLDDGECRRDNRGAA